MSKLYDMVKDFEVRHTGTLTWRLKKHCAVIEEYINPDEKILYAFCGQKNDNWADIFSSCVVALTDKRLLIGQKRVVWGSFYTQVTPDLYNDMKIYKGLFFGRIEIDTVRERIVLTNIAKSALDEIETAISEFMMEAKKEYAKDNK